MTGRGRKPTLKPATDVANNYKLLEGVRPMTEEYDFAHEAECLAHITKVIVHLKNYMEDNPTMYPPAMRAYITLAYGLVPAIHTKCDGKTCRVQAEAPCGGLVDAIEAIDEALECLDLELDMEAPSHVYPADYSI